MSKAILRTPVPQLRNSHYFHFFPHSNKSTPMLSSPRTTHSILRNLALALMLIMSISSCQTTKTIPLETLRHDTLYINKEHYDSIYIDSSHLVDRGGDTVYIKDKLIEYRFRLIRDTIRIVRIDSIPYEVRITEVKETYKPPNLFDYLCYLSFGILIGIIGWKMLNLIPSRH